MRIALFGSNSSISQSLKSLLKDEHEIVTFGRTSADIIVDINRIPVNFILPGNIDTLVLSSAHLGGNSLEDYINSINVNIIGTLKLIDLAIKARIPHFVYISSIYSHFDSKSPLSTIYSVSKKCSEEVILQFVKEKNISLTIIRPSQIIGNYRSNRLNQPFLYNLLYKIKHSENVIFFGLNNPLRNYIHIDDLSIVLYRLISLKIAGVFDCVYPKNISFLEIANHAKEIFKSKSIISFDESKPNILDNVIDSDFQLFELISYYPKTSILDAIEKLDI